MKAVSRWSKTLLVLVLMCSIAGIAVALTWSQMTRLQKTTAIMSAATADTGKWGGQCITWVRNKVKLASGGAVSTFPSVINNGTAWASSSYFVKKTNQDYKALGYGDIVQMRYFNLTNSNVFPHTAFIMGGACGVDGSLGFVWIDSNMSGNEKVQQHYVSNDTFYKSIASHSGRDGGYTIYTIK